MTVRRPSRSAVLGYLKKAGWFVAGLAVLQAVFFSLLVAGAAVPDKPIVDHLAAAVRAGTYGPSGAPDRMGGISDTFTECVVVGTGLGWSDPNPFARAVFMPRIANCQAGAGQILTLAKGQALPPGSVSGYYKYWSGYTVLTRPVLALFGLDGLRIVSGAMLLFSGLAAVASLAKRTAKLAAVGILLPLLLASNVMSTPSTSFSQAISISAIFLGIAISSWAASKSLAWAMGGVALSAALFCYVDLLTTPAVPWALSTAAVAGVTFARSRKLRETALAAAAAVIMWPVAFGFTWAARWLIAALFLGFDQTVAFIRSNVDFRSSGAHAGVDKSFGAPTLANWHFWLDHVATARFVVVAAGIVVVAALLTAWLRHGWRRAVAGVVIAAAAVVVPVWYEALNNHSQIHSFFTYRGIPAAVGVALFGALLAAGQPDRGWAASLRRRASVPFFRQRKR
ncbi:hypothetical protein KIH31_10415 [Paenarthrobacter sp. DKR-5]|uniref:hypothetical protein n=1 Tax=Paenarthrobacter sp. DKR-5 TaxID=2835535 RepID=UPI001BDD5227|nr:hypothetical protein [Paenarthrobacter sp. DKR-5]MBT1003021.1 hypothetical protein [Paenarthrobacter sp. DKR-5]